MNTEDSLPYDTYFLKRSYPKTLERRDLEAQARYDALNQTSRHSVADEVGSGELPIPVSSPRRAHSQSTRFDVSGVYLTPRSALRWWVD